MALSRLDDLVPLLDPAALPRVVTRRDAPARGMSRHAIDRRVAGGRWRRVLPHTYLTVDTLTWPDKLAAAIAFAGPGSLLSSAAVLSDAGLNAVRRPESVLVLVPHQCGARSTGWVRVRRTHRLPAPALQPGPPRVPVARAVADHALNVRWLDDVRALVAEAVQRGLCSVDEVAAELDAGPRHCSALLRRALADVAEGAWSAPEARAARLLRAAHVPPFEQNARIDLPAGRHYIADFLWPDLRAVLEIDSVEYHLNPATWKATMNRQLALETLGFSVAHRPPSAVCDHPQCFVQEISAWLATRATLLEPRSR